MLPSEERVYRMQQIRQLRLELPYYNGQILASEKKLKKYAEDYAKYVTALGQLATVSKGIADGQSDIDAGGRALPNYAGGNKYGEASGAISAVSGMFGSVASSGVGAIIKYVQTDMLLLNEEYEKEYPKYTNAIEGYNKVVALIKSLDGNASYKEPTITKSSLA